MLSPLPTGKWCYDMGRANCETFSVRPGRDGTPRICSWDDRKAKCQARPAAGLLCDSAHLIATNAKCKRLASTGGGVVPWLLAVVSRRDEDTQWAQELPIPSLVYEHAKWGASHSVASKTGDEAAAYLQYIVDHYHCLPAWTLFLTPGQRSFHGRGRRWYHALEPAASSALVDVDRVDRGFLAVGHTMAQGGAKQRRSAGASPSRERHVLGFVPSEAGQRRCECSTLRRIFGNSSSPDCQQAWGFPEGATFWSSKRRVRMRPLSFWRNALKVAVSAGDARVCFESLWHFLLGEPLFHYRPPYDAFEQLPLVDAEARRASIRQRMAQAKAGQLARAGAVPTEAATCGGASGSPACRPRSRIGHDPWCLGRCLHHEDEVDTWLQESGFELAIPRERKRRPPQQPRCDLCASHWIFLVSAGGRTGSTSLLSMLQAHPSLWLSGENSDQLGSTLRLWLSAAVQDDAAVGAWKRDPLEAKNLLCNVQQWFRRIAPGGPAQAIRGFKEIRWGKIPIPLEPFQRWRLRSRNTTFFAGPREKVRFLADLLFPCSKVIFVVREDAAAQRESMWRNWKAARDKVPMLADEAVQARDAFRKLHREWQAAGKAWHSFWLPVEDFGTESLNRMLEWMGETGCRFERTVHLNRAGFEGQQDAAQARAKEATATLQGKCNLRAQPGRAAASRRKLGGSLVAKQGEAHFSV